MDITHPKIEEYVQGMLGRYDEPVLLEMEAEGKERDFPIVGRMVGVALELLARSIGAQRVFELGSGFGYSAYWFSRATDVHGEVHLTDGDPENEKKAMDYLGRAGLAIPIRFHVGEAVQTLDGTEGEFDIVYCDIDKGDYPKAWQAARERIRPGGLYICDNTLWSGRVTDGWSGEDRRPGWTEAIKEHNAAIAADREYIATILPIRDGVLVAHRLR
jgi:predicted O-methyltransferase YrrM